MPRVPLSRELYDKLTNLPEFHRLNQSYAAKHKKDPGDTPREVAEDMYRTFYRPNGTPKRYDRMTKKPGGPRARFLERMGTRSEGSTARVGETPRRRRSRG